MKIMQDKTQAEGWKFLLRIVVKAGFLFVLLNIIFAFLMPLESLGSVSFYNWLIPGRDRLPYGENSAESYNLSLYNIPAMINSHKISSKKG